MKSALPVRSLIGIVFMDGGVIIGKATPEEFFQNPKEERTKKFLSQIL